MKLLLLVLMALTIGCNIPSDPPMKKPLVIIYKGSGYKRCSYVATDVNGTKFRFVDGINQYHFGDTIK